MVPRPNFIISMRRYRKKCHNHKYLLGSSPREDGFCSLETEHDERQCHGHICLFWQGYYRNEGYNHENLPWV
jgi:hypothetical protein